MTNQNYRKELKLIYNGSKLERIELEGVPLKGLSVLTEGISIPTLEELKKNYEIKYEYKY